MAVYISVVLILFGSALAFITVSSWRLNFVQYLNSLPFKTRNRDHSDTITKRANDQSIHAINSLASSHKVAAGLSELIHEDGAGSWPPRTNHRSWSWPQPIRPYQQILVTIVADLATSDLSLDDETNRNRITAFRSRFRKLLRDEVDLLRVRHIMEAANAGQWDVFPRDAYNAFYCCIATCRHAYRWVLNHQLYTASSTPKHMLTLDQHRWGTIPVVRVAQVEKEVQLPEELVEPWNYLQSHFGCDSQSGNNMSNLVLNFDENEEHVYKINAGLSASILSSEEAFSRIFREVEILVCRLSFPVGIGCLLSMADRIQAVPIYLDIIRAIISYSHDDKAACATYTASIARNLRPLLSSYYDRVHKDVIAHSAWLSHVQGFFAWGAGYQDESTGQWIKYDGLSGNQVLLFQALDAFLGLEAYLDIRTQERNVPVRQRQWCRLIETYSFRRDLDMEKNGEADARIGREMEAILKLLRVSHRSPLLPWKKSWCVWDED